eukprot:6492112-Amphidinium_carterae.1
MWPSTAVSWVAVGVAMLVAFNFWRVGRMLVHACRSILAVVMWLWYLKGRVCEEVLADLRVIGNAALFFSSEVLIVLARRCWCCRSSLRRRAMRWRPYSPCVRGTDEVHSVSSPSASRTPSTSRSSRRSLADIQREVAMHTGGCRKMGQCRLRSARHRAWETTYNPAGEGSCLFSALANQLEPSLSAARMRRVLKMHAEYLLLCDCELRGGYTLRQLLQIWGHDELQSAQSLCDQRQRWGNTADILVAAHLYEKKIGVYSLDQRKVVVAPSPSSSLVSDDVIMLGHVGSHFVAGRFRDCNARGRHVSVGGEPLQCKRGCGVCRALAVALVTLAAMCAWPIMCSGSCYTACSQQAEAGLQASSLCTSPTMCSGSCPSLCSHQAGFSPASMCTTPVPCSRSSSLMCRQLADCSSVGLQSAVNQSASLCAAMTMSSGSCPSVCSQQEMAGQQLASMGTWPILCSGSCFSMSSQQIGAGLQTAALCTLPVMCSGSCLPSWAQNLVGQLH